MIRKIYKLIIFNNPDTGHEERYIECRYLSEAVNIKNMLLNGRKYFSLTEETAVSR